MEPAKGPKLTWQAISVLLAVLIAVNQVLSAIHKSEIARLEDKITSESKLTRSQIEVVGAKLEDINGRLDRYDGRITNLELWRVRHVEQP